MLKKVLSKEQISEVKNEIKKCKNAKVLKKLQILKLSGESKKLKEISELTGYHITHISNTISDYILYGMSYITENKYKGNHRNMSKEKEQEFLEEFSDKAEKGEMLEVSEIRKKYDEIIGKKSGNSVIYYLLRRNHWRKLMPRSKNPNQANEEAVEAYKKNQRKVSTTVK